MNNIISKALIASIALGIVAWFVEAQSPDFADSLYALSGLGLLAFGGIAAYKLWDKENV